jgi:hypothetical protein
VGSDDKKVYALDGTTGSKKWQFLTGNNIWFTPPAIGADGTVYLESADCKVYALDGATGLKKWEFLTGDKAAGSPAIGADGTVYVGSVDKRIYALDGATGLKKWELLTGGEVWSSPAIGVDGTLYVGSDDGNLYALYVGTPLANSPWPMRGRNARHTASAEVSTGEVLILKQPQSQTAALGATVELSAVASGSGPLAWQWLRGGMALTEDGRFQGVNGPLLTILEARLEDAGSRGEQFVWGGDQRGRGRHD